MQKWVAGRGVTALPSPREFFFFFVCSKIDAYHKNLVTKDAEKDVQPKNYFPAAIK